MGEIILSDLQKLFEVNRDERIGVGSFRCYQGAG